jgi:hypothetical protein
MPKIMISARVDEKLNESLEVLAEATQRSKAFLISDSDWLSKWSPDNRLPPPGPDIFKSPRAKAIKRA